MFNRRETRHMARCMYCCSSTSLGWPLSFGSFASDAVHVPVVHMDNVERHVPRRVVRRVEELPVDRHGGGTERGIVPYSVHCHRLTTYFGNKSRQQQRPEQRSLLSPTTFNLGPCLYLENGGGRKVAFVGGSPFPMPPCPLLSPSSPSLTHPGARFDQIGNGKRNTYFEKRSGGGRV